MDAYYSQRGQGPQKGQNDHDTREPDAVKAASPVRRGAVRKGLTGDTSLSKTGTVYGSISTSLAAYSTKLVVTALEWSYLDGKTDVAPSRLKSAAELLVLRHDTLKLIDGAGPTTLAQDQTGASEPGVNGKEPERQTAPEKEQQNTTKTVEPAKEQVQTNTLPNCTFSGEQVPIDLKRFTDSGINLVECPRCGRMRSLSPSKQQTPLTEKRWSATGKTDWSVVEG